LPLSSSDRAGFADGHMSDIEQHAVRNPGPFPLEELLGISIDAVEDGRTRVAVEAGVSALNPNGVVHGAVIFAIADTAMAVATTSIISEDMACASIDVHVRFLRPAGTGRLEAEAVILRSGRRVVHLETRITDAEGDQVAMATGSFGVCPRRPARPAADGG